VPKRRRREQQHLRQEAARRRSYTVGGSAPAEKYKVGFPMNLLANVKVFYIIGAVVMVGSVLAAAILAASNPEPSRSEVPTPTPVAQATAVATGSATPASATAVNAKSFPQADQVVDAQTKQYTATLKTSKGDIVIRLYADQAPNTVNSFVFLAQKGFFDGITFHRVVPNFVIQGGDPTGNGTGGPGYQTKEEPNQLPNKRGTLAMAKTSGATSFGSQFFINLKDNPSLDYNNTGGDKFYPFAEVTSGMEVADAIAAVPTGAQGRPTEPVTIQSVAIQESPRQ
jgi:cyclophilin family peptidyl-prolyl cis-trans isomerase